MKYLTKFESWDNNRIDGSLFSSGRAKYNPHILKGNIVYNSEKYRGKVIQRGDDFICKIYKKVEGNDPDIRIKRMIKDDLRLAHNYVREFINQQIKKDEDKGSKKKIYKKKKKEFIPFSDRQPDVPKKKKSKVRRFD